MSSGNSKKASSRAGLKPVVSALCRAALREVLSDSGKSSAGEQSVSEHIEACGFCSARVQARATLAKWASARPAVPAMLASPSVLEGIYERAAEAVEQGPIGTWLEQAAVSTAEVAASSDADPSFLQDCLHESPSSINLLRDFVRNPTQPDAKVWSSVCRSILEGIASERVIRRQMGWRVLLVGAAAAAVVGLLAISEDVPVQPTITFADLDHAPDVAFANVRYGSRY
jgi:hypothetical protein